MRAHARARVCVCIQRTKSIKDTDNTKHTPHNAEFEAPQKQETGAERRARPGSARVMPKLSPGPERVPSLPEPRIYMNLGARGRSEPTRASPACHGPPSPSPGMPRAHPPARMRCARAFLFFGGGRLTRPRPHPRAARRRAARSGTRTRKPACTRATQTRSAARRLETPPNHAPSKTA